MFLITGLGNPGKQYEKTPHNAGFLFIDVLKSRFEYSNKYQVDDWTDESKLFKSTICKIRTGGEVVGILQKPTTYMNLSGDAVRSILGKFDITDFVLVHDDLDIKLGDFKIQIGKSPKGHNGVLSVERSVGYVDFLRVRIGIENRVSGLRIPGEDYVLQSMGKEEHMLLNEAIECSIGELLLKLDIQLS